MAVKFRLTDSGNKYGVIGKLQAQSWDNSQLTTDSKDTIEISRRPASEFPHVKTKHWLYLYVKRQTL